MDLNKQILDLISAAFLNAESMDEVFKRARREIDPSLTWLLFEKHYNQVISEREKEALLDPLTIYKKNVFQLEKIYQQTSDELNTLIKDYNKVLDSKPKQALAIKSLIHSNIKSLLSCLAEIEAFVGYDKLVSVYASQRQEIIDNDDLEKLLTEKRLRQIRNPDTLLAIKNILDQCKCEVKDLNNISIPSQASGDSLPEQNGNNGQPKTPCFHTPNI